MSGLAIFVSKRLQRAAFAFMCILAAQLVAAAVTGDPPAPGAVRVAIAKP